MLDKEADPVQKSRLHGVYEHVEGKWFRGGPTTLPRVAVHSGWTGGACKCHNPGRVKNACSPGGGRLPLSQEGAAGQQHRRPKRHSVRLLQRERQRQPSQRWPALFSRRQTALRSVRVSAHGLPPSALARLHNPAGN